MRLLAVILRALGVFIIVSGVVYGVLAKEYEGLTLMLTTAGGALLVGSYLIQGVHRAQEERNQGAPEPSDEEPHVEPTIWPLVFSLSMIGLVLGAVAARWILAPGLVLLLVSLLGWALDVRRQWQHHHAHGSGLDGVADSH